MYLAEKEAQPVADGTTPEYWGFCEDGVGSDRNLSRLGENWSSSQGWDTCFMDLRSAYNLAPGMRILCHSGVRRSTANFCLLSHCSSQHGKPWPCWLVSVLYSIWTWNFSHLGFVSLIVLSLNIDFCSDRPLNRKLTIQVVSFFEVLWRAHINRHRENWNNKSTAAQTSVWIYFEKPGKGTLANYWTQVLETGFCHHDSQKWWVLKIHVTIKLPLPFAFKEKKRYMFWPAVIFSAAVSITCPVRWAVQSPVRWERLTGAMVALSAGCWGS